MATRRKPARSHTANGHDHRSSGNGETTPTAAAVLSAVQRQNDLLYEAARSASDRSHRLTQAALDDFQSAQRDAIGLLQRWVESPFDLLGLYTGVVEAAVSARGRAAQSFARWRYELSQARTEAVEVVRRSIQPDTRDTEVGLTRYVFVQKNRAS